MQGAKTRAQPKTQKTTNPLGEYLVWTQKMCSFVCSLSLLFVWVLQPEKIKNLIECVLLFWIDIISYQSISQKAKRTQCVCCFPILGLLFWLKESHKPGKNTLSFLFFRYWLTVFMQESSRLFCFFHFKTKARRNTTTAKKNKQRHLLSPNQTFSEQFCFVFSFCSNCSI